LVDAARCALSLWDCKRDPPEHSGEVYRWAGYEEGGSVHSLLRYIETHAERLRAKYLAWVHDIGECRVGDRRVIDHLAADDSFSYWWMTALVEQSPWKTPEIIDAIRLLAVEEILLERRPDSVCLVSANEGLHAVVSDLCRKLGIAYSRKVPPDAPARRRGVRGLYQALPESVKGLISFARYARGHWPLRQPEPAGWFAKDAILLVSYFIHLDQKSCAQGRFRSHLWEDLPGLLRELGYDTNWLQHYLASKVVPDTGVATDWVRSFNRAPRSEGYHRFEDAYLSWSVVFQVLRRWLWLRSRFRRLAAIGQAVPNAGTHLALWPLMRANWRAAFLGPAAFSNLLFMELFDTALGRMPRQSIGCYLFENQGWERAFVRAWRRHGHGRLIAVAHSTVRFWDLRYFIDPRTLRLNGPQADVIALNGRAAIDAYSGAGFPMERVVECEALRYTYLQRLADAPRKPPSQPLKVLILGDYHPHSTRKMFLMLEAAAAHVAGQVCYTVKPHPSCDVQPADYPSLGLSVVTAQLGSLLHEFDVAYCSAATSAAVDAYLAGLRVVVMLDGDELNFSPLRGQKCVRFVGSAADLADALGTTPAAGRPDPGEIFYLDPQLPRWKRIIGAA
jgi:surface carbohydrate biosynthesis protein (TIGR04326 family)